MNKTEPKEMKLKVKINTETVWENTIVSLLRRNEWRLEYVTYFHKKRDAVK